MALIKNLKCIAQIQNTWIDNIKQAVKIPKPATKTHKTQSYTKRHKAYISYGLS